MVETDFLVSYLLRPLGLTIAVLAVTSLLLLYRVVRGPTLADRMVGLNTITTKMVVLIALLAVLSQQYFMVDVAVVFLMVNAVGGLILAKHYEKGDKT